MPLPDQHRCQHKTDRVRSNRYDEAHRDSSGQFPKEVSK